MSASPPSEEVSDGELSVPPRRLLRNRRTGRSEERSLTVVLIGVSTTVVCTLPLLLTGALAVQMRAELDFSVAELGLAAALYRATGALFGAPLGLLVDRIGPSRSMRAAAAVSALTAISIGLFARDIIMLTALLMICGIANPLGQSGANSLLSRSVEANRQGLAFGLKQSALPLGALIAGVAVPVIGLTIGWRYAFLIGGVLGLLLAARIPPGEAPAFRTRTTPAEHDGTPRCPLLLLALGLMTSMMAGSTLTTFTVDSAVTSGVTPGAAGLLLTLGSIVSLILRMGFGVRADRRDGGHFRTVAAMVAIGSVGYLLMGIGGPALTVVGVVIAFGFGWGFNGLFWFALLRLNRRTPGRVTGLVMPGGMLGGFLGPLLFGWTVETSGYPAAWTVTAFWSLAGASIIMLARRMILRQLVAAGENGDV